jgi:hypothetical protein
MLRLSVRLLSTLFISGPLPGCSITDQRPTTNLMNINRAGTTTNPEGRSPESGSNSAATSNAVGEKSAGNTNFPVGLSFMSSCSWSKDEPNDGTKNYCLEYWVAGTRSPKEIELGKEMLNTSCSTNGETAKVSLSQCARQAQRFCLAEGKIDVATGNPATKDVYMRLMAHFPDAPSERLKEIKQKSAARPNFNVTCTDDVN